MPVSFDSSDIDFKLRRKKALALWIEQIINSHGYFAGNIQYIFCSDNYLLDLNKKHLNHDFYTDIISFNYNQGHLISGDIFISIDRVNDNAVKFKSPPERELHRVMIHGILHFLGFSDKSTIQKQKMRTQEENCLLLLKT